MKRSPVCTLLLLPLMLTGCSPAPEPAGKPAWPELQYEPPALVELEQDPQLATHAQTGPVDPAT